MVVFVVVIVNNGDQNNNELLSSYNLLEFSPVAINIICYIFPYSIEGPAVKKRCSFKGRDTRFFLICTYS